MKYLARKIQDSLKDELEELAQIISPMHNENEDLVMYAVTEPTYSQP